ALLAINPETAFCGSDWGKTAPAVPAQPQAAPSIGAACPRLGGEEVLAQENILRPVPIDVGDADGKSGRPLGLSRHGMDLEVVASVQEDRRIQPVGLHFFH